MTKSFARAMFLLLAGALGACSKREVPLTPDLCESACLAGAEDEVGSWNKATLEALRRHQPSAAEATRVLALVHGAVFDALNSIYHRYEPVYVEVQDAGLIDSPVAAAASAAFTVLVKFFPEDRELLEAQLNASLRSVPNAEMSAGGASLGEDVARALLSSNLNGDVPFVLSRADQFRLSGPPADLSAPLDEVRLWGASAGSLRSADESDQALFWDHAADSISISGHWNQIAHDLWVAHPRTLLESARFYALLNLSLADTALAVGDMKEVYASPTPRQLLHDAGYSSWEPFLPSTDSGYASLHAALAGSTAEFLRQWFGRDEMAFTVWSEGAQAREHHYDRFSDAEDEAAEARILSGAELSFSVADGQHTGQKVSSYVYRQALRER